MEIGTMVSFGMETTASNVSDLGFCGFETGNYFPKANFFNPMFLDTDQWAQAMVSYGSKYAIFTAKHCSGYALWPTDVEGYDYNIRHSPWMDGKGDVVQMFIDSCKKYGILPGLYYGVGENFYLNILQGEVFTNATTLLPGQRNITLEEYEDIVLRQLTEIWTRYGDLTEIWFDGGTYDFSDKIANLLEKLQPNAIAFQGPMGFPNDIRWVGTELADPPYPCWSTAVNSSDYGGGSAGPETVWAPAESDTTIRNGDRWFWTESYFELGLKNVSTLFSQYEATVGRNTNFLLGFSPDPYGLLPLEDYIEYGQLGKTIQACYSKSINSTRGNGVEVILYFDGLATFNRIVLAENQEYGQRIREYSLKAQVPGGYMTIANGTSIGNKRIEVFKHEIRASSVQLLIGDSIAEPIITTFAAYSC
eukprot:Phypoly_transcript_06437.p1 GENE.Phypoly_transcript_06437~~Phypoly_transcript_06437.p1  ORF type:complete len:419 (+),score=34.79 Phypoly_transcript_06437:511-1767(+)